MIEIRRVKVEEVKGKIDVNDLDLVNTLFVLENNEIKGWGSYKIHGEYGVLDKVDLESGYELLRDGLIRAILNMMDYIKINYFVVNLDENEKLYRKIGFKNLEINNSFSLNENDYLYIEIEEFFNSTSSCGCHN